MANQFTKGTRTRQDDATRDKIRAELLSKRLLKYAKAKGQNLDKYRMEAGQVAAAKVLIDRGKPALSAVEQTIANPFDYSTSEELVGQLRSLLLAKPDLLQLLGLQWKPEIVQSNIIHITATEAP